MKTRRGQIVFDVEHLPQKWLENSLFYHIFGYQVGKIVGERIPVITGFPKRYFKR